MHKKRVYVKTGLLNLLRIVSCVILENVVCNFCSIIKYSSLDTFFLRNMGNDILMPQGRKNVLSFILCYWQSLHSKLACLKKLLNRNHGKYQRVVQ